jgi:hypothetical protein
MLRRGFACTVALGGLALALTPAAASAAASTRVSSIKVFTVGGHTSADVTVVYPDAGARKVSRRATNRGTVHVVVKGRDGHVLARPQASAALPVDVPRASSVQHTYRLALPDRVAHAGRVRVEVVADGHLDADGPGPAQSDNDLDADAVETEVAELDDAPRAYQYHLVRFSAGCDRDHATQCPIVFQRGDDSNFPFDHPRPTTPAGTLLLVHGARTTIKVIENATGAHSFLLGSVQNFSKAEFPISSASVPTWGPGVGRTGATAGAGQPGGPLYLQIDGATWSMWGYLSFG